MTPTEQEALMLGMFCEWSGKDDCRMVIEHRDGACLRSTGRRSSGRVPKVAALSSELTGERN